MTNPIQTTPEPPMRNTPDSVHAPGFVQPPVNSSDPSEQNGAKIAAPTFEQLLETLIEITPLARVDKRQYGDRFTAAREALREYVARLRRDHDAMDKMYTGVCVPLQECCQRHHLGLGGENVAELVVEEIAKWRGKLI